VLANAGYEAARNPVTMGYTFASGFVFSGLVAYLGTSQQIFSEQYQQGALFALWFAGFAVALALAMIVNGRFVMRFGMRKMTRYALYFSTVMSALFVIVAIFYDGMPPLPVFGFYVFLNFFCTGLLFGNYNALALEPVGHIAGMAAALSGFLSSLLSIIGGSIVGQAYHDTVTPLVIGFAIFGALAVLVTEWAEGRRARMLEAGSQTA
jgi:DHA1 family bicyclomycin/chloramphenicol resistance-like MFS transporter